MVFAPLPHSFGEVRSTILFEWHYNMLPGRDQWLFPFCSFDQVSSLRRCAMISRASLSPIPSWRKSSTLASRIFFSEPK